MCGCPRGFAGAMLCQRHVLVQYHHIQSKYVLRFYPVAQRSVALSGAVCVYVACETSLYKPGRFMRPLMVWGLCSMDNELHGRVEICPLVWSPTAGFRLCILQWPVVALLLYFRGSGASRCDLLLSGASGRRLNFHFGSICCKIVRFEKLERAVHVA